MKKKILSLLLSAAVLLTSIGVFRIDAQAAALEKDGDTYLIQSQDDWNEYVTNFSTYKDKSVHLTTDVTAVKMIGSNTYAFTGTFDGGGHNIELKLPKTSGACGLFSVMNSGCIKNLAVTGKLEAGNNSGCFVANAKGGKIENCVNHANAEFSSLSNTAAFIGKVASKVEITNCYNTGNITNGCAIATVGKITNCFNVGTIKGGYNLGTNSNANNVSTNSYYLEGSGEAADKGEEAVSEEDMKKAAFVEKLGAAYIAVEGSFPKLSWESSSESPASTAEEPQQENSEMRQEENVAQEVKVSVVLGTGINRYTSYFTVPIDKTLTVSYKFVNNENGIPAGYQMQINGTSPNWRSGAASGVANYTWQGGSQVDGITIGSTTSGGVPTAMALFTSGKPTANVSYTATKADVGKSISLTIPFIPVKEAVGEENTYYDIVYIDRESNEVLGKYSVDRKDGKAGKGCSSTEAYGIHEGTFERGNGMSPTTNFFARTENMNGYMLYRGKVGAPVIQKYKYYIGEDGFHLMDANQMYKGNDRIVICYLTIDHTKVERHTQKVQYVYKKKVVLEKKQHVEGYYQEGFENRFNLDMSGVNEELEELGYRLKDGQNYTVICNGNNGESHNPEISTFEVYRTSPDDEIEEDNNSTTEPSVTKPETTVKTVEVPKGKTLIYNGKNQTGVVKKEGYSIVGGKAKNAGKYTATVKLEKGYRWSDGKTGEKKIKWAIEKAKNPVSIKSTKSPSIKASKLKKKTVTIQQKEYLNVKKAIGQASYTKTNGAKAITVDKKTGKLLVKKGTKKGSYTVKIAVSVSGDKNHKKATKTITVKVKVK